MLIHSDAPTPDQIERMCQRAFGTGVHPNATRELRGGTVNRVYLLTLDDRPVVLRIAPSPAADLTWDERWLMRREVQMQPFFAGIAHLMLRIPFTDFTHELIDRDYMFQSFIKGSGGTRSTSG